MNMIEVLHENARQKDTEDDTVWYAEVAYQPWSEQKSIDIWQKGNEKRTRQVSARSLSSRGILTME